MPFFDNADEKSHNRLGKIKENFLDSKNIVNTKQTRKKKKPTIFLSNKIHVIIIYLFVKQFDSVIY